MELNDIKKIYLNPFLKENGFKVYKSGWIREIEDGFFTIAVQKGRYNTKLSSSMGLYFNVLSKDEFKQIKESGTQLWYGKVGIRNLLPLEGIFHELIGTDFYFDVHLTIDENNSVEILGEKAKRLFEEYVIPFADDIKRIDDYEKAISKIEANKRPHEMEVIHFFLSCRMAAFPRISNIKHGIVEYKRFNMTKKLIQDNMDIFDKLASSNNGQITTVAMHQYLKILLSLEDKEEFVREVNLFVDMNKDNPESNLIHITEKDYDMFFEPITERFYVQV